MANTTPAKHTPGPWTADIEGANTNSVSILGPDPRLEVAVIINDVEDLTGTDLANARLIAAAPAMLEALTVLVGASGHMHDDVCGSYCKFALAEAAIRLAKGEL